MGARNRVGIGLLYRPVRLHRLGGIDSLESIPGFLRSSKVLAQYTYSHREGGKGGRVKPEKIVRGNSSQSWVENTILTDCISSL
jgi:hypothetical protein